MRLSFILKCSIFVLAVIAPASQALDKVQDEQNDVHEAIMHDSLSALFTPANLALIEKASNTQDLPGSEESTDWRRHFKDDNFARSFAFMDRQKKLALDFAASADTSEIDRARALYHFGLLLHTAQDFYSHTNYLELKIERGQKQGNRVDPYSVDLVDWSKLPGQLGALENPDDISKANQSTPESMRLLGDVTYFAAAKELAVKESARQWNILETLIKVRFPTRATAIVTAMKHASCSDKITIEKLAEELP